MVCVDTSDFLWITPQKLLHRYTRSQGRTLLSSGTMRASNSNDLKEFLVNSPVHGLPANDEQFILDTDASDIAGAVLSQIQDGDENVIAYASRFYSDSERN